jgi:NADH-quinone oxidoreductase subunit B
MVQCIELGAASSPRYELERFGVLEAFGSLRQCDLIIVLGTVNRKNGTSPKSCL